MRSPLEQPERPRGRGSNYARKQWCRQCRSRTTHLYDHGLDRHLCADCELD